MKYKYKYAQQRSRFEKERPIPRYHWSIYGIGGFFPSGLYVSFVRLLLLLLLFTFSFPLQFAIEFGVARAFFYLLSCKLGYHYNQLGIGKFIINFV